MQHPAMRSPPPESQHVFVPPDWGDLRHELATLAARRDAEPLPTGPEPSCDLLARHGLLTAPLLKDNFAAPEASVPEIVRGLIAIGSADLSMARLWEGHLNAIRLIQIHGSEIQNRRAARVARAGHLLGVWGADTSAPVRLDRGALSGAKQFCSGLGVVHLAVVPVGTPEGQRLLLLDTSDPDRADPGAWRMRGMEATLSGRYDFDGLPVGDEDLLGQPDVFTREPWFLGGVWRIAAAELGGVFGLLEAARAMLAKSDRLGDPLQTARLGECLVTAHAARTLTLSAGCFAESADALQAPERAAHLSILARLAAERAAEECLTKVAKSIGLSGFAAGSPADRPLRDLQTYVRQMMPDALLCRASGALLTGSSPLAEAFDV